MLVRRVIASVTCQWSFGVLLHFWAESLHFCVLALVVCYNNFIVFVYYCHFIVVGRNCWTKPQWVLSCKRLTLQPSVCSHQSIVSTIFIQEMAWPWTTIILLSHSYHIFLIWIWLWVLKHLNTSICLCLKNFFLPNSTKLAMPRWLLPGQVAQTP